MLDPIEAKNRLAEFRVEGAARRRTERVEQLSGELSVIGAKLLDRNRNFASEIVADENGIYQHSFQDRPLEAVVALQLRPAPERRLLFDALFPTLSEYMDAAWSFIADRPYTRTDNSYFQGPFRAPGLEEYVAKPRRNMLCYVIRALDDYDPDIQWLAEWVGYLDPNTFRYGLGMADNLALLLAAAIDSQDANSQLVFNILADSADNRHAFAAPGSHIISAFLNAGAPEGWAIIERQFREAGRDEGFRSTVMEIAMLSHPMAFRRIVKSVHDNSLTRHTSVVKELASWLSLHALQFQERYAAEVVRVLSGCMEQPNEALALLGNGGANTYIALIGRGFDDAVAMQTEALNLVAHEDDSVRLAALWLVGQIGLPIAAPGSTHPQTRSTDAGGITHGIIGQMMAGAEAIFSRFLPSSRSITNLPNHTLLDAVADPDIKVAALAFSMITLQQTPPDFDFTSLIDQILERLPVKDVDYCLDFWPLTFRSGKKAVGRTIVDLVGKRSLVDLLKYIHSLEPDARQYGASMLAKAAPDDEPVRSSLLKLCGDSSPYVRTQAFQYFFENGLRSEEAAAIETLLSRKADDQRMGGIKSLLTLPNDEVLFSIGRLLENKDEQRRLAGLELSRQMICAHRSVVECKLLAKSHGAETSESKSDEAVAAATILKYAEQTSVDPTTLGLYDPADCTHRATTTIPDRVLSLKLPVDELSSLYALIESHGESIVEIVSDVRNVRERKALGEIEHDFPRVDRHINRIPTVADLPLADTWFKWYESQIVTEGQSRTSLALLNAANALVEHPRYYVSDDLEKDMLHTIQTANLWPKGVWPSKIVLRSIVGWLLFQYAEAEDIDIALDGYEAHISISERRQELLAPGGDVRYACAWIMDWEETAYLLWHARRDLWSTEQIGRLWRLTCAAGIKEIDLTLVAAAYEAGFASRADVLRALLGLQHSFQYSLGNFRTASTSIGQFVDEVRYRVVEIEIRRGEADTPATPWVSRLPYSGTMDTLFKLLACFAGRKGISLSKPGSFASISQLIRLTKPATEDTSADFAARCAEIKLNDETLLDLAILSPQWSGFVEKTLHWIGLSDAIAWIYCHGNSYLSYEQPRIDWIKRAYDRTSLTRSELTDGAVDLQWFRSLHAELGEDRWHKLFTSALSALGGTELKRPKIYTEAILGKSSVASIIDKVEKKRSQDDVRALGLAPLPEGAERREELLKRYAILQEFLRSSKQFGAMRRENEAKAVQIGMDNLARCAGFGDPIRLQWAMEQESVADLAAGPVSVSSGDTTVTLSIDTEGAARIEVVRAGKKMASVPAAAKKDPSVTTLTARVKEIDKQAVRMRQSLQDAMCRGDLFHTDELYAMMQHPVLSPIVRSVLFVGNSVSGYPCPDGVSLEDYRGAIVAIPEVEKLRVAHPWDLAQARDWAQWQSHCFRTERIQPFKQVFRELYVRTELEPDDAEASRRYAGHQLNGRRASGILRSRGWVIEWEEGIRKTYPSDKITAWLGIDQYYGSVADAEEPTVEQVWFTKSGSYDPLPLSAIPARLFSEVMRDIDLLVSVAHASEVDPEASQSSMEMRADLVREACALLKLSNVSINDSRVVIKGTLATYSIHLGSAVVHRQPGGHLCIVPVAGQHRGRIFLPFADDDPRTAEVVSKVILLARDQDIKDPIVLAQILGS